jgi:hypothetical protein
MEEEGKSHKEKLRELSIGDSTDRTDKAALYYFDAFLDSIGYPSFYELKGSYFDAEESIKVLLADYIEYLVDNPMNDRRYTKNTKEGEEPELNKPISPNVALKYFMRVRVLLSQLFPDHPDLQGVETSYWWVEMQNTFLSAMNRRNHGDTDIEEKKVNPLYMNLENQDRVLNNNEINVSNIDLKYIQHSNFVDGKYKHMAYNAFTFHNDGRGGEIKFLKLSEMRCDPILEWIIGKWREPKTFMKYSVAWLHNKYKEGTFLTDLYFCTFLYFTMASGLWREDRAFDSGGGADMLFHDLQKIRSDGVAKAVTTGIRKFIPKNLQQFYSAKSIRIGATTSLRLHRDISHIEELGRSGHSTSTNSDKYIDRGNPMITVPGGLCLAGFENCHVHPSSPCINIMTKFCSRDVINSLIDKLICYNPKHEHMFGRDGTIRPFLEHVVASGVMYFNDVRKQYHGHSAVQNLFLKAQAVGIDLQTLIDCSDALKDDYILRSQELPPDTLSLVAAMKEMTINVDKLSAKIDNLCSESVAVQSHILSSPPPETTKKVASVAAVAACGMAARSLTSTLMDASKMTSGGLNKGVGVASGRSNNKLTIMEAIVHFHKQKKFLQSSSKQSIKQWALPNTLPGSTARVNKGLEFISICMTDHDFQELKLQRSEAAVKQCAQNIHQRVFKKYAELFAFDTSSSKSRVKPSVEAMGTRISSVINDKDTKAAGIFSLVELINKVESGDFKVVNKK